MFSAQPLSLPHGPEIQLSTFTSLIGMEHELTRDRLSEELVRQQESSPEVAKLISEALDVSGSGVISFPVLSVAVAGGFITAEQNTNSEFLRTRMVELFESGKPVKVHPPSFPPLYRFVVN